LLGLINPNATAASLSPFKQNAGAASALGGSLRMGVGAVVSASIGLLQGESALTMFTVIAVLARCTAILLFAAPKGQSQSTVVSEEQQKLSQKALYRYYFGAYFLTTTEGVGDSSGYPATREERGEGIQASIKAKIVAIIPDYALGI